MPASGTVRVVACVTAFIAAISISAIVPSSSAAAVPGLAHLTTGFACLMTLRCFGARLRRLLRADDGSKAEREPNPSSG